MGIEPTWPAWKAGVLPLNYTRMLLRCFKVLFIIAYESASCQVFFIAAEQKDSDAGSPARHRVACFHKTDTVLSPGNSYFLYSAMV